MIFYTILKRLLYQTKARRRRRSDLDFVQTPPLENDQNFGKGGICRELFWCLKIQLSWKCIHTSIVLKSRSSTFLIWWHHKNPIWCCWCFLCWREIFFAHYARFIRCGSLNPPLRPPAFAPYFAPLRSLRSLHSLRKVSSK